MCRHGIWKYTHINTNCNPFIYQSVQFWAKLWAKSPDCSKTFLNLSQFWLQFGKILKNRPIHIPNFAFHKGSFVYPKRLILLPMLVAHLRMVFCTEDPPPRLVWYWNAQCQSSHVKVITQFNIDQYLPAFRVTLANQACIVGSSSPFLTLVA